MKGINCIYCKHSACGMICTGDGYACPVCLIKEVAHQKDCAQRWFDKRNITQKENVRLNRLVAEAVEQFTDISNCMIEPQEKLENIFKILTGESK